MNYPSGINHKQTKKDFVQYGNRGMSLESDLNITNTYYIDKEIAYIYKKPTPIQIVKVDYPSRNKAVIKEAYFKEPSTTDYNGIYKGRYVDFEAKETKSKSFPLANIHIHQVNHLRNVYNSGGIAFLIIRFNQTEQTYLLMAKDFLEYIDKYSKKSIPLSYFKEKAHVIELKYNPRLDYISILDKIMEVQKWQKKLNQKAKLIRTM